MKSVAIIGGGITGLTAAFRLVQAGVPVQLYEGGPRAGGVIQTLRRDGYLAESGPNSILETSPKIGALIQDLGITNRRLYSDPLAEKRYVVRNGRPVALPGSALQFLTTPLFSWAAKLRLAKEPFIARAPETREESIAEFVQRRIGREFLDYAINPFVAGVYAGDPAKLSVEHAFPKLQALEQRYGSLLLGQFLGAGERKRRAEVSKAHAKKLSFDEGLQVLIDALRNRLGDSVQLNTRAVAVEQAQNGYFMSTENEGKVSTQSHSAVLFAGTAHALAALRLETDAKTDPAPLAQIQYPPVTSIVLGFRRGEVAHPLDGFGMLVPEVERCHILGTIFSSTLFPNRAPAGCVALTCYIGGARAPELACLDQDALLKLVLQDLRKLLGVGGPVTLVSLTVFRKAIPQYNVGFGRFKDVMNELESKTPGFFLAGNYRDGISLSDSIVSGHTAAERVQSFLAAHPTQTVSTPAEHHSEIAA